MKLLDRKTLIAFVTVMLLGTGVIFGQGQKTQVVGGGPMSSSKNIVENAAKSKDHTTLVAAVKAAGLLETLQGAGPYTVFAPTNAAFRKLPQGTVQALLKPENKDKLSLILSYHMVGGKINSSDLMKLIKNNGGTYKAKAVAGGELAFIMKGNNIIITDEKGGMSKVTIKDVNQSNGMIHVVDTVLLPKG